MRRVPAPLPSRAYDVLVGRGCLAGLGTALMRRCPGGKTVVCCDENVAALYLEQVRSSLRASGYEVSHIVIPAGEAQKDLARAEELYGVLYDRGLRRGDTVVALGGGVIGDLAGFVAATYQRGVRLAQVPTTLLAQVDAAVGGKVAVDFRAGKNYVGTFYQPWLVYIDLATLETLPVRELHSGAAEVAKYALLDGGELLGRVERLARGRLVAARVSETLVAACVARKVAVVAGDEREETGARAVLNLGHTVGHAVGRRHGVGVGLHDLESRRKVRRQFGAQHLRQARQRLDRDHATVRHGLSHGDGVDARPSAVVDHRLVAAKPQ